MKKVQLALGILLLFALATMSFGADAAQPALKKVEPKTVCMITEHAMGKPQIPVTVDGKTYYGCCDMCKKTLATDATKRVATDPQSGAEVDKASAVIAADADGKIFYFENDKNLKAYNAKLAKGGEKK